jgi:hypothetical protein
MRISNALKYLFVSLLALCAQSAHCESCTPVPKNMHLISGPYTVAAVESKSIKDLPKDVPAVPFGYINEHWESLKKQLAKGDEIWEYEWAATKSDSDSGH